MSADPIPPVIPKPASQAAPRGTRFSPPARQLPTKTVKVWEGLFRVFIALALLVAVVLAWWSVAMVWMPRQEKARKLSAEVGQISADIDRLERVWSLEMEGDVTNKFPQVRSLVFSDEASLTNWYSGIEKQALDLDINIRAVPGPASLQSTNFGRVSIIPFTLPIEVHPVPDSEQMPSRYNRLLRLVQRVAASEKRIDLSELTVSGGTNSTDKAVLMLNVWAREEEQKK